VTKTKSVYAALPPEVRAIIDRSAPTQAKAHGITLKQAREALAKRVIVRRGSGTVGTGH
jgi:hypothetical protein